MAAAADRNMENKGLELGSWGTLLGQQQQQVQTALNDDKLKTTNRLVVLADESSDTFARQLVPTLSSQLQDLLPDVSIETFKPTATVPIGGNNAAAILVFATSFSNPTVVRNMVQRLCERTLN